VRFWHFAGMLEDKRDQLAEKTERGYEALGVMENHLREREVFVGGRYTIADVALYAYTHVAHEGGFELDRFPAVQAWLARVAAQPGHVAIEEETGTLVEWP